MSRMNSDISAFIVAAACLFFAIGAGPAFGQSAGIFTITQATVAGGGGPAVGGSSTIVSTTGQTAAGAAISGPGVVITAGFWKYSTLTPTAAMVSISGRVRTSSGQGIPNASLTLFLPDGSTRTVRASPLGFYQFDGVTAGETVVLGVWRKAVTFSQPMIAVKVFDEIADLDFIGVMD